MNLNEQIIMLMDQVPDNLWIVNMDFRLIYINKSVEAYGWTKEGLCGKHISYFSPPETVDACYSAADRFAKDPENNHTQKLIVKCFIKDTNETYTLEVFVTVLRKDGIVIGYCGISRDITNDLLMRKQLSENQMKKHLYEIAGGISHEMSQPLTIIGGIAVILKMINKDKELDSFIDTLIKESNRANKLIHKLQSMKKYSTKTYLSGKIIDIDNI